MYSLYLSSQRVLPFSVTLRREVLLSYFSDTAVFSGVPLSSFSSFLSIYIISEGCFAPTLSLAVGVV